MKLKKLFAVAATLFVMGFSAFAFDGKTFWKEYGGGLKNGDSLVHMGVGLSGFGTGGWFIPPVSVGYEKLVHINGMLPFSFGGFAAVSGYGATNFFCVDLDAAATARYHFNLGIDKLDVYTGLLVGAKVSIDNAADDNLNFYILYGANVGASYFFNEKSAISVDCGYPYWVNVKYTMKL